MGWHKLRSEFFGYLLILSAIFAWSTQAFVSRIMVESIGFFSVYFFASLFTAITAFVFYFFLNKNKIDFSFLSNLSRIIVLSIFLTITNFLLFASFELITATNVIVLLYVYPILMAVEDSLISKKKFTNKEIIALSLGFFGVLISITKGNPTTIDVSNIFADFLVLVGAFSWATYLILQKKYNLEEFSSNGMAFLLSTLYSLPIYFMFPQLLPNGLVFPNLDILLLLLYFSIVTFALGNVLYVKGLKRTKIINTALLTYLTPVIAIILNFFILKEKIFWYDLVPLLLIFIGYLIANKKTK